MRGQQGTNGIVLGENGQLSSGMNAAVLDPPLPGSCAIAPPLPAKRVVAARPLVLGQVSPRELRRRIWHMSPGLLPVLSWAIPHKDPLSPTYQGIIVAIIGGLALAIAFRYHTIARQNERNALGGILGYATTILFTLLLFPAHAELGMVVLAVLAFGDGSATLGGLVFRGPPLPWNPAKTFSGFASFVLVGAPAASLAYWAEAQPAVSIWVAAFCGTSATLVAAIAESLPTKVNDNVRVGLAAAITVVATHAFVVGLA